MENDDHNDEQDDASLFRRLMSDITPLDQPQTVSPPRRKPPARARFSRADEQQALQDSLDSDVEEYETSAGEHLRFQRPAVGRRTMRRLARGSFAVQDELDLHGMTRTEAREALRDFIADCAGRGHTCVRIVHGKGRGSGDRGPVLKRNVNAWLRRWDTVLAFTSARQVDGGTGALYVLLRRR